MMLRRKLAQRYAAIVVVCLVLFAGLLHHEFVTEPAARRAGGTGRPPGWWAEWVEVILYGMIPVVLGGGWWLMRKTLRPINDLAQAVERIHAANLHEPIPRTGTGDEVDRLIDVFNATTARLHESFQQIREFTLHASHELKTPLTVMRAQLETVLRECQSHSPAQCDWLHSQIEEVQRLGKIVDGLTLLTKADAGLVALERRPVALRELVTECFEDAQILAEPHGVRVELGDCVDVVVNGDRHRLRQVLLNLSDNALKYNQRGGSVKMSLQRRENTVEFIISNTGPGIPAHLQGRVFDRFVRGPQSFGRAEDGCGLGLTIVRWIVTAHGGRVLLNSVPGGDTTVRVQLPITDVCGSSSPIGNGPVTVPAEIATSANP